MRQKNALSKLLVLLIMAGGVALAACQSQVSGKINPRTYEAPPLYFEIPRPRVIDLAGGVQLFLIEDHELPLIRLRVIVRTGAVYEPPEQAGVAAATGAALRDAGTRMYSSDELNYRLEHLGAKLNSVINRESGEVTLTVFPDDLEVGLNLLEQVLFYPVFEPPQVDLIRDRAVESLARLPDSPFGLALRKFKQAIYRDNPRGVLPTFTSLKEMTPAVLRDFHTRFYHPANMIIGVAGDFNPDDLVTRLQKIFAHDNTPWSPPDAVPPPSGTPVKRIYLIPKAIPQSVIVLGHLTIGSNHPDYYAMDLIDHIVGSGGFRSRLVQEVRSNRGLAYSANSFYSDYPEFGVWGAVANTKTESTLESLNLMLKLIKQVSLQGVTQQELDWAKESRQNSFVFSVNTATNVLFRMMNLKRDGLPLDFLDQYPKHIAAVNLEQANDVARRYLQPDKATIVVVGDISLQKQLSPLGPIEIAQTGSF